MSNPFTPPEETAPPNIFEKTDMYKERENDSDILRIEFDLSGLGEDLQAQIREEFAGNDYEVANDFCIDVDTFMQEILVREGLDETYGAGASVPIDDEEEFEEFDEPTAAIDTSEYDEDGPLIEFESAVLFESAFSALVVLGGSGSELTVEVTYAREMNVSAEDVRKLAALIHKNIGAYVPTRISQFRYVREELMEEMFSREDSTRLRKSFKDV